ncbi:YciI family protein [Microbacterium sp.]|uniref:YciI family protein n=1 Tax=Microbacterium sp. TaxID=51671 RepID=UPI00281188DD|nr:YciI family protein [Microbacterium sp.]
MSNRYLVIHMTESTGEPLSRDEDQRLLGEWFEEGQAAGRLHDGAPVASPESAKSVAVRDGKALVTDGPFPEFKEWFAGYDIITADSIDEAAAYMSKHPTAVNGRVYILPVVKLPWD